MANARRPIHHGRSTARAHERRNEVRKPPLTFLAFFCFLFCLTAAISISRGTNFQRVSPRGLRSFDAVAFAARDPTASPTPSGAEGTDQNHRYLRNQYQHRPPPPPPLLPPLPSIISLPSLQAAPLSEAALTQGPSAVAQRAAEPGRGIEPARFSETAATHLAKFSSMQEPVWHNAYRHPEKSALPSLLSAGRPATASVRGNLGEPGVVTNEATADWLHDRWQAAKNMKGEPILGQHWVEIDLQRPQGCSISRGVLDWETAFASAYRLEGLDIEQGRWASLMPMFDDLPSSKVVVRKSKQHIVHDLKVEVQTPVSKVRVLITKPATRWGVSLWRFQVYGTCN